MKKRILAYLEYVDNILKDEKERDWDKEIERHLNQISFFSHERLVHLLVFILVAIATVITILDFVNCGELMLIPLIILFFVLLIPYCAHYYLLENSVQKMYEQYDLMVNKKESYFKIEK